VRVGDVIGVVVMTTAEALVEDTVAIATMTAVTEEVEGMTIVEDTVVVIATVITGVVLGLAVVLRVIVVAVPRVTVAAAVLAALDIVDGIMMTVVPLIVEGLGIMIGDMNVLIVDTEMGGKSVGEEEESDDLSHKQAGSCCH